MTLEKLDNAIAELAEAKRLAELFGWPESAVNRINLVLRGAIHYRKELAREMENDYGIFEPASAAIH